MAGTRKSRNCAELLRSNTLRAATPVRTDRGFEAWAGVIRYREKAIATAAEVFAFNEVFFALDKVRTLPVAHYQVGRAE
jgi:hypothetical protein